MDPSSIFLPKFTYIDTKGNRIGKTSFDYGRDFSEGLAPVQIGKLWGFIDKNGAVVISPKFEDAEAFSSGLARIRKGDFYGYVNKLGEIVIPPQYKDAESFSEGFAVVGDTRGRLWYIDIHGDRRIPGEFAAASPFFKGLADVRMLTPAGSRTAKFAYIDKTGRQVFTY